MTRDYGYEAHRAAMQRWEALEAALSAEEVGEEPEWPEDMFAPYDGCDDCVVREILHAAWPLLQLAAQEEM